MPGPLPDREAYFERWTHLHGGYDPRAGGAVVRFWLSLAYVLARPLARAGVSPDAVTGFALVLAGGATGLAGAGGRWLLAASTLVVLSGLVDNLDGAVAVLTGRASAWGYVLDSVADRLSDGLYLVGLWLAGAPGWVCVAGGTVTGLQEYTRARAGNAGMGEIGVVTVAERPTRVIVAAAFLLGCGLYPSAAPSWAAAGATAWLGVSVVGLVQLLVTVRRRLR